MMDGTRWDRIQAVFHAAVDRPEPERTAFLKSECGADEQLLSDVLAIIRADSGSGSLLDGELAHVAHALLGEPIPVAFSEQFGPYRIKHVLGEGGMGVVYLAERSDLGSMVAIKVLRDAWLSPARRERFASEQRTLAQLNHPSIARLYDADTLADGTPWFAMEFVGGSPLTEHCHTHGYSVAQRLRTFRSVCDAVRYAHGQAIIHRDLKPSNILVRPDGSVKLLDFGIAKQIDVLDTPADRTRTGLRLLTPAYAAPEQIRREGTGVYTDVYSLGVILYELLTGVLPHDLSSGSLAETERLITDREPEKPSAASRRLLAAGKTEVEFPSSRTAQTDLDVLCLKALHADPQRRYRSVEALIRDIDHYLNGEPLEARPDSRSYRLRKFAGRNRRSIFAVSATLLLIIGLVTFFTFRLAAARNAALDEAARAQRIQDFLLSMFDGGDRDAGPASDLRVVSLLERGALKANALAGEPKAQAELRETLGGIYAKLGELKKAEVLLGEALDAHRKMLAADDPDVAESLIALGMLRVDQAQYDSAESLAREALSICRRSLPPKHPLVAKATAALGRVLEERGKYAEAIDVLNEAVRLSSSNGPPTPELASSLLELANTHFYAGHYAISEQLDQRVLLIHGELYGPKHPLIAEDLINLGAIRFNLGRYAEAEQFDRKALEITRNWYGADSPKVASNLTMLGRAVLYQSRNDEARDLLEKALVIQERVYGPMHPKVASALNDLGSVCLRDGDLKQAEEYFRRIYGIYRAAYGDQHYLAGVAVSNLAGVYMERRQYARAERLYREAVQRFTSALSPQDLNTGIARIKLGRALLRQRRFAEAEVETLAGYDLLRVMSSPSVSFLRAARSDLAAEYEALGKREQASQVRVEIASNGGDAVSRK
jgi:eukaryotic-like serine/threonine-protein kinase